MHPQTIKDMFTKGPPCLIFPVSTASRVSRISTLQLERGVSCHQMSNYLVIYFHSFFVIHHLIFYLIKQAKSTISWKVISTIPTLQLSILGLSLSKHLHICHGRTKQQAKLNPWSSPTFHLQLLLKWRIKWKSSHMKATRSILGCDVADGARERERTSLMLKPSKWNMTILKMLSGGKSQNLVLLDTGT